jgi:hypothetical protein
MSDRRLLKDFAAAAIRGSAKPKSRAIPGGTFKKADQNIKKGAIATAAPLSQVKAGLVAVNANDQQRNFLRANFSPRPSCLKGGIRRPVGAPGGIDCPERPPPGPPWGAW